MKKSWKKKMIPFAALSTLAVGAMIGTGLFDRSDAAEQKPTYQTQNELQKEAMKEIKKKHPEIKNVIFMIGDGMGPSYMAAHRYMKDNPNTPQKELTEFDKHFVGMQTTYSDDDHENITDSAAAATAMSGGKKTYNNAIAVDKQKHEIKTVLEQAKENGMTTGLVATSEITHATPASFGAHDESRKNMDQLADDYYNEMINGKHKIDVMLGGGKGNFVRKDVDLTKKFQKDGFRYVTSKDELLKSKDKQVLGLFADGGLPNMIDRPNETPSLKDMTTSAIDRLKSNKDGFFLMVEGSQIDWAGHDNDVVGAMSEMEDFERAYKAAIDFAKKDKHTLVVATADHSTGGFSIGANDEKGTGIYNWDTAPIKAAKRTPNYMADQIVKGASVDETLAQYLDFKLTPEELQSVKDAAASKNAVKIDDAIEKIINMRSHTGWTTSGHTGEEVGVYAYGPGKEMFSGLIDNTQQAENIFHILDMKKKHR